jgi:DNA uptake protein ComE-like DNA-binding protein
MHKLTRVLPLIVAAGLAVGACGSSSKSPTVGGAQSATSTTVAPATTPTTRAASATTSTPTTTAAAAQKVNANTASQAEIQAALAAAGVPSAAQWAREVTEYRPYPTNDPTFAKLRQNLVKYNPGPGVVDQIVAVLAL